MTATSSGRGVTDRPRIVFTKTTVRCQQRTIASRLVKGSRKVTPTRITPKIDGRISTPAAISNRQMPSMLEPKQSVPHGRQGLSRQARATIDARTSSAVARSRRSDCLALIGVLRALPRQRQQHGELLRCDLLHASQKLRDRHVTEVRQQIVDDLPGDLPEELLARARGTIPVGPIL